MSNYFQRRFQMTTPLPTDLYNLKCQFESWRKTRTKRTRTPDHLLKAAADLLDQYPISTICRVCRINPRTLRGRNIPSKNTSKIQALPDTDFFPLSLAIPQAGTQPTNDCRLLLERPDGARLSIFLPTLNGATISTLCSEFFHLQNR